MDAKVVRSQRLDQLDAEQFDEMVKSSAFRNLRLRIEDELERSRKDCERHRETEDIYRSQGATAALRVVLGLPTKILAEIRSAAETKRK